MKRNLFFLLIFIISACQAQEQKIIDLPGHNIQLNVKNLHNETVYLANYVGDKMYYADTALVDDMGHAEFKGNLTLPTGKYALVFPDFKFLQMIVAEQHFTVETDTSDYYLNAKAKNSPNNKLYFDYFRFLSALNKEKSVLLDEKKNEATSPERLQKIDDQFAIIDEKVKEKLAKENENNKGTFYSTIIGMIRPINVPEAPLDDNGNIIDSSFRYNYYREHFFDYTNLNDGNIVRTPEYQTKINEYFNKVIPQVPDSMPAITDRFLAKVNHDPDLYSYTLRFLAANFKRSKYMGMEIGYVHVIENYFNDETIIGLEPDRLKDAIEEATDMKHSLLGNIAPDVNLHDVTKEKYTTLHSVKAPYTLLYIWSPTCSHCLEENPDVVNFYNRFKDRGIKVYAICADQELEDWRKYLKANPDFASMINVADSPGHRSKFRNLYNTRTTPVVLLLDKNKKILTKRLNVKQVGDFLENLMSKGMNH